MHGSSFRGGPAAARARLGNGRGGGIEGVHGARPAEVLDAKRIESVPSSTGIPDLLGTLKTSASVGSNVEGQRASSRAEATTMTSILVDGFL